MKPPPPATLEDVLEDCLRRLARGVADRRSPFHTPSMASVGLDGAPALRTVVLRGVDVAARTLRVHTDRRSAKYAELARDPRAALHGYDPGAQIQLRLAGTVTLHAEDAVAEAAWTGSREASRLCYAIDPAPGTPVEAPPPAPRALDAAARGNFAALVLRFDTLEWLWLSAEGHRRARFDWAGSDLTARWLVP